LLAALVSEADWRSGIQSAREAGAELICLPLLSFSPYMAGSLDREGYEQAERSPSPTWKEALELAGDVWLSASPYESEGEGVFYFSGRLGRDGGEEILWRQRNLDAFPGRFEPMFAAPGHQAMQTVRIDGLGNATLMLGGDLRSPELWAEAARIGVDTVIGAAAEPAELWQRTELAVAGMAAAHGLAALVANRGPDQGASDCAGGAVACDSKGAAIAETGSGLYEIEIRKRDGGDGA
jgi:predicted amidohydrolase